MTYIQVLDLLALVALGLSGGSRAVAKGMDFYGAIVLAVVTSFGGGMTADLLVGRTPAVLRNEWVLLLAAGTGLAAFFAGERLQRWTKAIAYLDAVGLGLYAVAGAQRGILAQTSLTGVVFLGVVAGTGGGMIRDVLSGEIPYVLRKEIYALAAAAGALAYGVLAQWRPEFQAVFGVVCAGAIMLVRMVSIYFNLSIPAAPPPRPAGV